MTNRRRRYKNLRIDETIFRQLRRWKLQSGKNWSRFLYDAVRESQELDDDDLEHFEYDEPSLAGYIQWLQNNRYPVVRDLADYAERFDDLDSMFGHARSHRRHDIIHTFDRYRRSFTV